MFIIWGHTPKEQHLEQREQNCFECKVPRWHSVVRRYRVGHIFWFPLFSFGVECVQGCAHCGRLTHVGEGLSAYPPIPWLHRLGFLIPLLAVVLPCFVMPMAGALISGISKATERQAEVAADSSRFAQSGEDAAFARRVETQLRWLSVDHVTVLSAKAGEHRYRAVAVDLRGRERADWKQLSFVLGALADEQFPQDEVHLGASQNGRPLGYSQRSPRGEWQHRNEHAPDSLEAAEKALRAQQMRELTGEASSVSSSQE